MLRLLGAGSVVALAGCAGDDGDGADGGTDTETATDTETETETPTEAPQAEPVEVPADASCPVCGMNAADFPDWNAQVLHEDDERAFFCTAGCATTYYAVPEPFAATDAAIAGLWVTDVETRELIDGFEAHYALETNSERLDDPMMKNPAPFADRDDAVAYVDEVEYLSTDDIVELSAFDRNLAEQYRARFLEDQQEVAAVEVPDDASCAVCEMDVAKFPDWNAQALHEDDERAFFCTAGCATTYYAVPEPFAATDAAIAGLWVTDVETRELIDGSEAHYALETDSERLDDPMMKNPAPFADREDAVAYVDAVDYLTTDDIVELSAFDRDLAEQYRGRFLEE